MRWKMFEMPTAILLINITFRYYVYCIQRKNELLVPETRAQKITKVIIFEMVQISLFEKLYNCIYYAYNIIYIMQDMTLS